MGKGSTRRPGDGFDAGYDRIFGKRKVQPEPDKVPDDQLEAALKRAMENERARFNGKD